MNDYVLPGIQSSHAVVLADTNVLELKSGEMRLEHYRELKRTIGQFFLHPAAREKVAYLKFMKSLFRSDNIYVTELVAEELMYIVRHPRNFGHSDKANSRYQKELHSFFHRLSKRNRLGLTYEESRYKDSLASYFGSEPGGVSETDFDILLTSVCTAAYRGPTAVLSDDMRLKTVLKEMAPHINTQPYRRKLGRPLMHRIDLYTKWIYPAFGTSVSLLPELGNVPNVLQKIR